MKQIIEIESEAEGMQSSHQGHYLKNLMGHSLDLPDQLLFDTLTHTFLEQICKLLDPSLQEAMD